MAEPAAKAINKSAFAAVNPPQTVSPSASQINVSTYNIHDILSGDQSCPVTLGQLQHLIMSQASLHRAKAVDDQAKLKDLLTHQGNTLRGFVLYADDIGPVAYAIYYPMIDRDGARGAYCEDFYIESAYRGYGVGKILFKELAQRTMEDNAEFLQWATDKRNSQVHKYVQRIGAKHPNIVTLSANTLMKSADEAGSVMALYNEKASPYTTRKIEPEDVNLPAQLGLSPNIIRNTGDLAFKGFVTFEKGKPNDPVALIPGWTNLSTFQLSKGSFLEHPTYLPGVDVKELVASFIHASRNRIEKHKLAHFRMHIEENSAIHAILRDDYQLNADCMVGTPESELLVYTLRNGELKALANSEPERIIRIPNTDPIGESLRVVPANQNKPGPV